MLLENSLSSSSSSISRICSKVIGSKLSPQSGSPIEPFSDYHRVNPRLVSKNNAFAQSPMLGELGHSARERSIGCGGGRGGRGGPRGRGEECGGHECGEHEFSAAIANGRETSPLMELHIPDLPPDPHFSWTCFTGAGLRIEVPSSALEGQTRLRIEKYLFLMTTFVCAQVTN